MATLADRNVSLHATPLGGSQFYMPERQRGSYVSARSLTIEANFSRQAQEWHVVGTRGAVVRKASLLFDEVILTWMVMWRLSAHQRDD